MDLRLLGLLLISVTCNGHMFGRNAEEMLYHDMMESYDDSFKNVRPVEHHEQNMTIAFSSALININRFDEDTGEGEFMMWDRYMWNDHHLIWDPEHYDNINAIRVPIEHIWRPDMKLYNSLQAKEDQAVELTMAVVSSDGSVLWIPPTIRKIGCKKSYNKRFVCQFKYGSWTYDGNRMPLAFYGGDSKMDITAFIPHHHYQICKNSGKIEVKTYACCPEPYPAMYFDIELAPKNQIC